MDSEYAQFDYFVKCSIYHVLTKIDSITMFAVLHRLDFISISRCWSLHLSQNR